ncbi:MAG: phenylalanine--tRNA ligase subunit beta [Candidatus Omnitrophota bacterium]
MKFTYNWIKNFLDIKIPAQGLADKLTMAGLEVTSLEKKGGDFVFELEITSNRPDWLSIIGIAREVGAITNSKCRAYSVKRKADSKTRLSAKRYPLNAKTLKINIEDKNDCLLYDVKIITGIKVGPSPDWLSKILESVGMRSVNNIVDIANYVLMETGQPLHTFDLDKLINLPAEALEIIIRRAKKGESITTIDGLKRDLDSNNLIIASYAGRQAGKKSGSPIAIAGIMGGQDSEINEKTTSILLETAVFNPIATRRSSRAAGLSSDSSYRFERGVDSGNVEFASMRATELILKLASGGLALAKTTSKPKAKKKIISLNPNELNRILGTDYRPAQIKKILSLLSFSVSPGKGALKVTVPSFRSDVNQPVDLIEEMARIAGYEGVPMRLPKIIPQNIEISPAQKKAGFIKDILISQGANEAITYSLISRSLAYDFGYADSQLIAVANPLTNQQEVLRPSLIPGLVSCLGYNLNQKQKNIRLFEVCNKFQLDLSCLDPDKGAKVGREELFLGMVYSGKEFSLLNIKGALELLLECLGAVDFEFIRMRSEHPFFQKEMSLSLSINLNNKSSNSGGEDKTICADLGMIKSGILEKFDIKDFVFAAELDLEVLLTQARNTQKKYLPLPLYPEIVRDISVMLKRDISIGSIIKRIETERIPYLVKIDLKDQYLGKQIPAGYKGITLSCVYRASDRTLTTEEVEATHQKAVSILEDEFSAQPR